MLDLKWFYQPNQIDIWMFPGHLMINPSLKPIHPFNTSLLHPLLLFKIIIAEITAVLILLCIWFIYFIKLQWSIIIVCALMYGKMYDLSHTLYKFLLLPFITCLAH